MSRKSDRDNRSNQLNPNNPAYHSARHGPAIRDEHDCEEYKGSGWLERFDRAMASGSARAGAAPDLLVRRYFVDIVSLDGAHHLAFDMRAESLDLRGCEAAMQRSLHWIRQAARAHIGDDLAMVSVHDATQDAAYLEWASWTFRLNDRNTEFDQESRARRLHREKLWMHGGMEASRKVLATIKNGASFKERLDLGTWNWESIERQGLRFGPELARVVRDAIK